MRIATLMANGSAQTRITDALVDQGIEVGSFETAGALVAAQAAQPFAAILVEDSAPT
jgi:hypothetical protein